MTDNEETLIEQLLDEDHNWHSAACAKAATQLQALAAVIEADREAVRAEQAAKLAKWKALAETLAGALDQIKLICEEEPYKVVAGQKPCKHTAAINEVYEEADQALTSYKEQRDVAG